MPEARARLHAIVSGTVQGVYFRSATQSRAAGLGLSGWVRNLSDGSVEVLAEGMPAALRQLGQFLRVGPPEAMVTEVREEWLPASGEFAYFDIRW
jgi:acylphosphatase